MYAVLITEENVQNVFTFVYSCFYDKPKSIEESIDRFLYVDQSASARALADF